MKSNLHDLTASQLRAITPLSTQIAHLGTRLNYEWSAHPASPYLIERLAYLSAASMAREEEGGLNHHTLYGRVFDAKPEGCRYWLDAGLAMRFQETYEEIMEAVTRAAPFHRHRPLTGSLRAMSAKDPLPLAAMIRAREHRTKCYTSVEASLEAQRTLASEGLFPAHALPLIFETPRLRADGDWLIGAMRRFAASLQTTMDVLTAATQFLERAEDIFVPQGRKTRISVKALPVLAGRPTLRSTDLMEIFSVSQKAALSAMAELEEAGIACEIRGLDKWQVWTAEDPVLGLPAPPENTRYSMALPGGKVVSIAA